MASRDKFKVYEGVFDNLTFKTLYSLRGKCFDKLLGPVSTGKEADVYLAENGKSFVALKIYRIRARLYKSIDIYIRDDPRFKAVRNNSKEIIYEWTKKEFRNLLRAENAGVRVPHPIKFLNNVLVMEFIGKDNKAAPLARNAPPENPEKWKSLIFKWIKDLWEKGGMVHGDLSEWNILNYDEEPVIIDISQGVLKSHPLSIKLLRRDVNNITRWFNKLGCGDNSLINWLDGVLKNV